ncbi:hypothetical protein PHYPSEUDO_013252 [Phytophthora pseudosyringae]|uniref:diacylglycerol O-acyltransferase n=1 Tax=Phytophthora pseudosyringae TaxID=221518 RepID=A0A8T1W742_9STRA|nr:hypothetical protein PHYPSEUDO_013252 [Phytophthora pseudosyringae]
MRGILHWMEFSSSAKASMQSIMRTGQNLCLLPGGFEEATLYQRVKHRVYIKQRFGLIKLALQHGYDIYPAYTFGEEYTYHAFPYLQWLRLQLNRFRIPGAVFFRTPLCFFLPRSDVDLITVVGAFRTSSTRAESWSRNSTTNTSRRCRTSSTRTRASSPSTRTPS